MKLSMLVVTVSFVCARTLGGPPAFSPAISDSEFTEHAAILKMPQDEVQRARTLLEGYRTHRAALEDAFQTHERWEIGISPLAFNSLDRDVTNRMEIVRKAKERHWLDAMHANERWYFETLVDLSRNNTPDALDELLRHRRRFCLMRAPGRGEFAIPGAHLDIIRTVADLNIDVPVGSESSRTLFDYEQRLDAMLIQLQGAMLARQGDKSGQHASDALRTGADPESFIADYVRIWTAPEMIRLSIRDLNSQTIRALASLLSPGDRDEFERAAHANFCPQLFVGGFVDKLRSVVRDAVDLPDDVRQQVIRALDGLVAARASAFLAYDNAFRKCYSPEVFRAYRLAQIRSALDGTTSTFTFETSELESVMQKWPKLEEGVASEVASILPHKYRELLTQVPAAK